MKFIRSGKNNPCPVCHRTKDQDCSWTIDRSLVLCHANFDHENSTRFGHLQAKQEYKYIGQTSDSRCGKYIRETYERSPRRGQIRNWVYTDRNNNPLLNVRRIDQEGGDKKIVQGRYDPSAVNSDENGFVYEHGGVSSYTEIKQQVCILYYKEVQEAIKFGIPVYWVEGEQAADALRKIGLIATTSIGGSKAFKNYADYKGQLLGANLVICPDADLPGIEYAEQVEDFFQKEVATVKWLYPFPFSPVWRNLPSSSGLDIVDWIEAGADKDLIESSCGEKRNLSQEIELQAVRDKYNKISSQIRAIETILPHPGERYLAYLELARKHNLRSSEIGHLKGLQPAIAKIKPESFAEFCKRVDDEIDWLVEGLIPRSHNILLAGQPGSGKSLLVYDLIYCVLTGSKWLNRFKTQSGRVLFLQLEEGEGYVPKSRAITRGIQANELNLMMMFSASVGDLPGVISFCQTEEIDLCVIDSLTAMNGTNTESENQAIYALPLQMLTSAAAQMKTTFITVHHTKKSQYEANRKDKEEMDSIDEVRGSGAITGNSQAVLLFKKYPREGELARSLKYVKARIKVDYSKHIIKLNTSNNAYNYVGDLSEGNVEEEEFVFEEGKTYIPGEAAAQKGIQNKERVKDYILTASFRCESIEISNALGLTLEAVDSYLYHLEQEGVVVKERNKITGRYTWRKAEDVPSQNEPEEDYLLDPDINDDQLNAIS